MNKDIKGTGNNVYDKIKSWFSVVTRPEKMQIYSLNLINYTLIIYSMYKYHVHCPSIFLYFHITIKLEAVIDICHKLKDQ